MRKEIYKVTVLLKTETNSCMTTEMCSFLSKTDLYECTDTELLSFGQWVHIMVPVGAMAPVNTFPGVPRCF